jgi:transposase
LDEFSKQDPDEFKIIILDNGAFHKAAQLEIPPNITLLFIPPYTPELNPAEKIWRHIKDAIANEVFPTIDDLSNRLCQEVKALSEQIVKSITGFQVYLTNFNAVF